MAETGSTIHLNTYESKRNGIKNDIKVQRKPQ